MIDPKDPFSSARLLLLGANEDIAKIDAECARFFDSKPHTHVVERDSKAGRDIIKLKMARPLPPLLSRDVARVANEIRSSLDQTGYATAFLSGNTRLKYTYFPFGASAKHLDDVIRGRCKDLSADIKTLFRSFDAYRGGNDLLWAINEVANGIKHRFIVPVGKGIGGVAVDNIECEKLVTLNMPPVWDTANDEIVLYTVVAGSKYKHKINLAFFIAFGDIDVVRGMHIQPTLREFAAQAGTIIDRTEAECRRLGLITS